MINIAFNHYIGIGINSATSMIIHSVIHCMIGTHTFVTGTIAFGVFVKVPLYSSATHC